MRGRVAGVLAALWLVAGCGSPEPRLSNGRTAGDMEVDARVAVRDKLRDPDSAQFGTIVVRDKPEFGVVVCGMVNTKNGFGGYSGEQPFIFANGSAEVLAADAVSVALFERLCSA